MQLREKILLTVLLTTLVLWWGSSFFFSAFLNPLEDRERQLNSLLDTLDNKELEEAQVISAINRLSGYRSQSLPADPNAAQRGYAIWLTDLLEDCGWAYHEVLPGKVAVFQNLGSAVQIRIEGLATSEQLAFFLDGFEESEILHRIERLALTSESIEPDSLLSISLTAEALALSSSKRETLENVPTTPELTTFWQSFAELSPFTKKRPVIVRNPQIVIPPFLRVNRGEELRQRIESTGFASNQLPLSISLKEPIPSGVEIQGETGGPQELIWKTAPDAEARDYRITLLGKTSGAQVTELEKTFTVRVVIPNTSPELQPVPPQILYPEESWSFPLAGTDRDQPAQRLTYSFSGNVPAGLTIDSASGLLNWKPGSAVAGQNFSVTAQVTDSGDPPLKASQTIQLSVQKDTERTTYLIGCVEVDGVWTAWFVDRDQNRQFALKQGETLQAGRFKAVVSELSVDSVKLTSDKAEIRLALGDRISDRIVLTPLEKPTENPPAELP